MLLAGALTVEALWRVYGLRLVIHHVEQFAPSSAEQVSREVAPLLQKATNAEPLYRIIRSQHVELHKEHEFLSDLAQAHYQSWVIVAACSLSIFVLLLVILVVLRRSALMQRTTGK